MRLVLLPAWGASQRSIPNRDPTDATRIAVASSLRKVALAPSADGQNEDARSLVELAHLSLNTRSFPKEGPFMHGVTDALSHVAADRSIRERRRCCPEPTPSPQTPAVASVTARIGDALFGRGYTAFADYDPKMRHPKNAPQPQPSGGAIFPATDRLHVGIA